MSQLTLLKQKPQQTELLKALLKLNPPVKENNSFPAEPYLFVLGCVMDSQIPLERAWQIPKDIATHFKTNNFKELQKIPPLKIKNLFLKKKLHRFNKRMADFFNQAVHKIHTQYNGEADLIWKTAASFKQIAKRFKEFKGVGPKIAHMAVNILYRNGAIPKTFGRSDIDISADTHVKRVMSRLGLVGQNPSEKQVIRKAQELNPSYPGALDIPLFKIGRNYCHARKKPKCQQCPVLKHCPHAKQAA